VIAARFSPVLGLILGVLGVALLAFELTSRPLLSRRIATHRGNNVLGIIPSRVSDAEDEPARRMILTAHLDSSRSGLLWRPRLIAWFRPILAVVFGAAALAPVLLLGLVLTGNSIVWLIAWIPVIVLLVAIAALLESELRGLPVSGAIDNASGIAAMLAIAGSLARDHPTNTETWVLFTTGQEAGLAGMTSFLSENHFDPTTTYFINIDHVGAGQVCYTRAEGIVYPIHSSPTLVRIAGEIAELLPDWGITAATHRLLPTDQYAALVRGYQAISIIAYGPGGSLPYWHQRGDTVDKVELPTVQIAADFALALIRKLDSEATREIDALSAPTTTVAPPIS
jgi:hypothetical protein